MMKTAILLAVLQFAIGANLPSTFKRCHLKEQDFSECLNEAVADAVRKIGTTGIPSLNMGPLQPMTVKEIKVDQGGKGPVSVKVQFMNMKIYGIPNSSVKNFRLDNNEIRAESLTPDFKIEADYTLDGHILLLPIRGRGKCTILLDSLIAYHIISGTPMTRNGEVYLELQKYDIKLRAKKMHVNFRNLFNGDKTLGETMNNVLNENWDLIFKELRPALETSFGNVFLGYAKGIFDNVPFNDIFPQ